MFTIEQIIDAHSKIKSGADFPSFIQDLKKMGVIYYESFVIDGHTDYFGERNYKTTSPSKYNNLTIADNSNIDQFKNDLKAHQQGKTDYLTFCNDCAKSGITKWVVNLNTMTCIYYDRAGNEILIEQIPN